MKTFRNWDVDQDRLLPPSLVSLYRLITSLICKREAEAVQALKFQGMRASI